MSLGNINVPPSVAKDFFRLLGERKFCEAFNLLPYESRLTIPVYQSMCNSTVSPNATETNATTSPVTVQIFTKITIIGGDSDTTTADTLVKIYAWIIIITSIIGIIGNSLVIGTHLKKFRSITRRGSTRGNVCSPAHVARMLFMHLAMCDLIFAILQTVLISPSLASSKPWPYGIAPCKIILGSVLLGSLVAIGTILVIASERYGATMKLSYMTRSKRQVVLKLGIVWLSALLTVIPYVIALTVGERSQTCDPHWDRSGLSLDFGKGYNIFLLIVWFVFPCGLILFYYGSMINLLRKPLDQRGFKSLEVNQAAMIKRRENDIRAIKILLFVVIAFFICCLPIRITRIITDFIDTRTISQTAFFALKYTGQFPYPFHVCVNPLIYSVVDRQFRSELMEFICGNKKSRTLDGKSLHAPFSKIKSKLFKSNVTIETSVDNSSDRPSPELGRRRQSDFPQDTSGVELNVVRFQKPA